MVQEERKKEAHLMICSKWALTLFIMFLIVIPTVKALSREEFSYHRNITITNNDPNRVLEEGYTVNITLNTQQLITSNKMRSQGLDFAIAYVNTFLPYYNLSPFNEINTTIAVKLIKNVSASGSDSNYEIFYGNSSVNTSSMINGSQVFQYFENWDGFTNLLQLNYTQGWQTDAFNFTTTTGFSDGAPYDFPHYVRPINLVPPFPSKATHKIPSLKNFKISFYLLQDIAADTQGFGVSLANNTNELYNVYVRNNKEEGSCQECVYTLGFNSSQGTHPVLSNDTAGAAHLFKVIINADSNSTNSFFNITFYDSLELNPRVVNNSIINTTLDKLAIGSSLGDVNNISLILYQNNGGNTRFHGIDTIIYQKYMNPEPTITLGSEISFGVANISIYDELTDTPFNLSNHNLNNTYMTVFCPQRTEYLNVTSTNFQINVSCPRPEIRLTMNWKTSEGQVWRTRLISQDEVQSNIVNRFYMLDVTNSTRSYNFQTIVFNDITNKYTKGRAKLEKVLTNGTQLMIEQNLGARSEVYFHMAVGDRYILTFSNNTQPDVIYNPFTGTTDAEFPILYGQTGTISNTNYKFRSIAWVYDTNPSGTGSVTLTYNDTEQRTSSVRLRVYNMSNTSIVIYDQTQIPSSYPLSMTATLPTKNQTYLARLDVVHDQYGAFADESIVAFTRRLFNISGVSTLWFNIIALFFIMMIALLVQQYHAPIGTFVISLIVGMFYYFGFLDNLFSGLAITIIIAMGGLGMFFNRRGDE